MAPRFLDGDDFQTLCLHGSDFQKGKGQEKAQIRQDYANISVNCEDGPDGEIRIFFQAESGSWSAIRNDCLVGGYFSACHSP